MGEQARLEECASRHRTSLETASTDDDGLILRLLRHPRAADATAHLCKCCSKLQEALGPDVAPDEAERRLRGDEKFTQFLGQLNLIESDSIDEAAVARSLKARTRILADAHVLGQRVQISWDVAREAIEKVKLYRQLLGARLAAEVDDGESKQEVDLQGCLSAIAEAWPDVEKVSRANRGTKRGADSVGCKDAKRLRGGN